MGTVEKALKKVNYCHQCKSDPHHVIGKIWNWLTRCDYARFGPCLSCEVDAEILTMEKICNVTNSYLRISLRSLS